MLSSDEDRNIVLFSSNGDLDAFYRRLDDYDGPIPEGQRGRRYENFVARIEDIGALNARDRLGMRMKKAGYMEARDLLDDEAFLVDVELWEFGSRSERERKAQEIDA